MSPVVLAVSLAVGTQSAAESSAARGLLSRHEPVRTNAVKYLASMGPRARPHLRALCDRLAVPPLVNREAVLEAVEAIDPVLYKPLREYVLANPDEQYAALKNLRDMRSKAAPAVGFLAARFVEGMGVPLRMRVEQAADGSFRPVPEADAAYVYRTISWVGGADDPAVVAALRSAAAGVKARPDVRVLAVGALDEWAGEDAARRKGLIPVLEEGLKAYSADVVVKCLEVAAGHPESSRPLLPAVRRLKLSPDKAVREAATRAAGG